jgi:hypothetical protein
VKAKTDQSVEIRVSEACDGSTQLLGYPSQNLDALDWITLVFALVYSSDVDVSCRRLTFLTSSLWPFTGPRFKTGYNASRFRVSVAIQHAKVFFDCAHLIILIFRFFRAFLQGQLELDTSCG